MTVHASVSTISRAPSNKSLEVSLGNMAKSDVIRSVVARGKNSAGVVGCASVPSLALSLLVGSVAKIRHDTKSPHLAVDSGSHSENLSHEVQLR